MDDAAYHYGRPALLGVGLGGTGTALAGVYDGTPAADAGLAEATASPPSTALAWHRRGAARGRLGPRARDRVEVTWTDASGATRSATVELVGGPVA